MPTRSADDAEFWGSHGPLMRDGGPQEEGQMPIVDDDPILEALKFDYLCAIEDGHGYETLLHMQATYPQYAGELSGFVGTHALMETAPEGPEPTPERMARTHQIMREAFKKVFGHYPNEGGDAPEP